MNKAYDVIVIGGGPAGYAAALYTVRSGFSTLVIERMAAGGQMNETTQIDNYPGFDDGIDGFSLGMKMQSGAQKFGAETKYAEVKSVNLLDEVKEVEIDEGTFNAKAVIIATGAGHKHLGLPGESELVGRGVGYCAACDGMFYRGKTVAVVGGGNSAAADALVLSRIAKKVHLIHRRDQLRATKIYHDPLEKAENVEFHWNSAVSALHSGEKLTGITLKDVISGAESELELDGLFISIGRDPATKLFRGQLELDEAGYIVAGESTETSVPGVYAVGDVRTKAVRQIITAASDGAIAAHYVEEYLKDK
ncbi:MAG: thioredoxin-disulfide reductase [Oscillospiraceae bacterium]|nr:thioredoxin-disulfide reductase [Oscillospiraceae bacterium]